MNVLVSIVVPVYKVERYLDRCVNSIVSQSYERLEIILVDDGSPDDCPALCDAWAKKDARIRVIHKKNQGLGEARNSGLREATGKYIFFFDSDDYVAFDAVEKCIRVAEENNADTVIYGRNDVYPDGRVVTKKSIDSLTIYEEQEIKQELIAGLLSYTNGFGVSAWSKMFITDIIKENLLLFPSERAVISEDSIFCLEYFSKAKRVAVLPDKLYFYFKNDSSLTRAFKPDRQIENNAFLNIGIKKIRELRLPNSIDKHLKARYHGMTLGALAQIAALGIEKKQRRKLFREIYNDKILRDTLKLDVIANDAFASQVFWTLLKIKCFFACDALLFLKSEKKERGRQLEGT